MAAANPIQSRADLHAPCVMVQFAASAARDLTGADAPRNAQHLPCGVIVQGGAGANFVFKDINGATVTIPIAAAATIYMPIAPAELTAANGCIVTACWQVRLNAKL